MLKKLLIPQSFECKAIYLINRIQNTRLGVSKNNPLNLLFIVHSPQTLLGFMDGLLLPIFIACKLLQSGSVLTSYVTFPPTYKTSQVLTSWCLRC